MGVKRRARGRKDYGGDGGLVSGREGGLGRRLEGREEAYLDGEQHDDG